MKCSDVLANMGFECKQLSERMLRVWSPFTYGMDGEVIGVYVERTNAGYRVTDGAESLMHAESMGISLSKARLGLLDRIAGRDATISNGGEIFATASESELPIAIAAVVNAATAVSHLEFKWMPRAKDAAFTAEVGEKLARAFPPEVITRNAELAGASGHQFEIPFVISLTGANNYYYIQPVAYGDGRVNWDNVYRSFGKMVDLKNVGTDQEERVVVVDDRDALQDIDQSVTFLSAAASVVRFRGIDAWISRIAA